MRRVLSNSCSGCQPSSRRILLRVDRVPQVVAGAVGDERDLLGVALAVVAGAQFVEDLAERADQVEVGPLIAAADVVGLARLALPPAHAPVPGRGLRRRASHAHFRPCRRRGSARPAGP